MTATVPGERLELWMPAPYAQVLTGLYAPVRLPGRSRPDHSLLAYGRPASLLGSLADPHVDQVADRVDASLRRLVVLLIRQIADNGTTAS